RRPGSQNPGPRRSPGSHDPRSRHIRLWSLAQRPHSFVVTVPTTTNVDEGWEQGRRQRGENRGGGGDQAGQADGAIEVGGLGRGAIAEGAAPLGPALVDVGAAEADAERPGERRFAAA